MKDTGIYMENETLGNFARNTAAMLEPEGWVSGRREAARILATLRTLKGRLTAAGAGTRTGAAEWFSDNWYLAEREGKEAAGRLSSAGRLPRAPGERSSCVAGAAGALIRSGRGQVTGERIELFLDEYQKNRVLSQRELELFVPALKGELCVFLEEIYSKGFTGGEEEQTELTGNIFTSLRTLAGLDPSPLIEAVDRVEAILRRDPAGIYKLMDEDTRAMYRRGVSDLAKSQKMEEHEAAARILKLASSGEDRHVGTYIFTRPLGRERRPVTGGWYMAVTVLGTLFFTLLAGVLTGSALVSLLGLMPVWEIVKNTVDHVSLRIVRPRPLPKMELEGGIPRSGRTVCVISALLTKPGDGERYGKLLEEYRLLNRDAGENLLFGILADLPEARERRARDDGRILEGAKKAVDALNRKYSGGFYLFARERELSRNDNIWMGRERKRGAIEDLVRLLSGEKSALRALAGDEGALKGTAFILTLDGDTRLTLGSAKKLVGAALHPLNVPVIDESLGRVVSGYGIFEPRIAVDLRAAGRSDFSRVFAGEGGVDPYSSAVSDLYQDLFGEGTFMGKGLINVPVYKRLLDGVMPDNTVLSHDILEGAYMRCAFVSDVELTDGWPFKVTSYFARQERWTRGDWQNLRWCMGYTRRRDGSLVRNTLTQLDRWKLIDNLRRSLLPAALFAAIFAGLTAGTRAMGVAAALALGAAASGLLLSAAGLLIRRDGTGRARYQSAIIAGPAGAAARLGLELVLLPAQGWIQLRAAATAIWRMTVSHRGMLQWVTSSDTEGRRGNTPGVNYRVMLACPLSGAGLILLTPYVPALAVGAVWIFAPAVAWRISRERRRGVSASQSDRAYLLARAREIWRYFEENLTGEDNFLPPDNIQEEPSLGPAHRTSPTNVGLAMLACVAAADLGLVGETRAAEAVRRVLDTVERMEKWRGHLYNWYDTRTLSPMEPRYVSTVDSGNLMGALIAVRQWFLGLNDPESAERCERLVADTDLGALYDRRRRLFTIGWDMAKNAPTQGYYDLLASEARQTSYIAVALGAAPGKHWRALGRALVSLDGYSGMASWTGTMFEYLMPDLLLPCPEDSAIYESSRFCLYAQRRAHTGIPWGISESAYYAFDPGLSYRYKAHGVARLALKRGMGSERVISPYSTYLALPFLPAAAVRNLRRLEATGAVGRYGLFEALDYTVSRVGQGRFEPVRTFMAHHLGMSLVAIANTLCDGVFPRRFMSDERMGAYRELLEERVPTGQVRLRQPPRDVPAAPRRFESSGYAESFTETDGLEPRCTALSNGGYTVIFAETGATRSTFGDMEVTRFDSRPPYRAGMAVYLVTPEGAVPVTAAPDFERDVDYASALSDVEGRIRARRGGYCATMSVSVPPSASGETRTVEITAPAGVGEVTVVFELEPVLCPVREFDSHPAFSKLALEADMAGGILTVRRRPKPGQRQVYMAVAANREFAASTHSRRGDGLGEGAMLSSSPDMAVKITVPVKLTGGRGRAALALAVGREREETRNMARAMLAKPDAQTVSRVSAAALMLGMNDQDVRAAMGLISPLIYGGVSSDGRREALGRYAKQDLWTFGISGDLPLIAGKVEGESALEGALALIRRHAFLAENGVRADLALTLTDSGDYRAPQRQKVTELMRALGRDGTLGKPGGVYLLDAGDPKTLCVEALADVCCRLDAIHAFPAHKERMPRGRARYVRGSHAPSWRMEPDGTFRLALRDVLPEAAWSHILTNGEFGFLATECGTGYMWYGNSRLMKLTPATGDAGAVEGPERVELTLNGRRHSLFADGSGEPTMVEYGFGWAAWERDLGTARSRVTAFVPEDIPARIMVVELDGELEGAELEYSCELMMSEGDRGPVVTWGDGECLTARNTSGPFKGTVFHTVSDPGAREMTTDGRSLESGRWDSYVGAPDRAVMALRYGAGRRTVIASGCVDERVLRDAVKRADKLLEDTRAHWRDTVDRVKVRLDDENIDAYMSGWAVYQTLAGRLLARTGLYQNGGATGFRDQLQDACALIGVDRSVARRQLVLAAGHQYREGDVAHWWHATPEGDMGVRTRCSDDLMWLPWALTDYVSRTGDMSVLGEQAPFLESQILSENERDRYERARVSEDTAGVMDHALLACRLFMDRGTGSHGLSLMLGGDWNDGFDGVGKEGRGESVWLTFFGSMTLRRMAELCEKIGRTEEERELSLYADRLLRAGEGAWTGRWYLRGYYDDGRPLGAPGDGECEIDSIAQSFAVFAGADRMRCREAVLRAYDRLFDPTTRTVKLFDPPFDRGDTEPGYIKTYAPGYRENGGQYTHAAIWLAMALIKVGERERGRRLLSAISPWGRDPVTYALEPYVLAGDVCSAPGHEGRGGWSWYTGSAGWYFRAVTECLADAQSPAAAI